MVMVLPLTIQPVDIDEHSIGEQWEVNDLNHLARLVGIILMGQAKYAHTIINTLNPASPAFTHEATIQSSIVLLTVKDTESKSAVGYPRYQRDGLLFEIISWIAVCQQPNMHRYTKDPHLRSTIQGLDGLMLEMSADGSEFDLATFSEDKCVKNPRKVFKEKVIPAFVELEVNKRAGEIVAAATALLTESGLDEEKATIAAARILDKEFRKYRSTFAIPNHEIETKSPSRVFGHFKKLKGLTQEQKSGAQLIIDDKLRDWFDGFASRVVDALDGFQGGEDV